MILPRASTHLNPALDFAPKRHLDRFIRFCTTNLCAPDVQTHTQTTLRAAWVAVDRIYSFLPSSEQSEMTCKRMPPVESQVLKQFLKITTDVAYYLLPLSMTVFFSGQQVTPQTL